MATTMSKPKPKTRPQRWAEAQEALNVSLEDLRGVLTDFQDLQEEYREWLDNLPDSLKYSAVGEKLEAITQMDFDDHVLSELENMALEVENADLPLGFGKD